MSDSEKDYKENCPVCKTKWTKTPRPSVVGHWTHCLPCNKKADTILAEEAAKPVESVKSTEKSGNKATSEAFSSYQMDLWDSWGDDDSDYWGGL